MTAKPRTSPVSFLIRSVLILAGGAVTGTCFYVAFIGLVVQYGDAPGWMLIVGVICSSLSMIFVGWLTEPKE